MNTASSIGAAAAALLLGASQAMAVLTASSGYSATSYHTHTSSDAIVSYDWSANGDLYYTTSTSSYSYGGTYRANSGGVSTIAPGSASSFAGGSTVVSGNYVYFNTSDTSGGQFIHKYGPTNGVAGVTQISSTPNNNLLVSGSSLYITGAIGFGTNHIYYSGLDASGNLVNNPVLDFGATSGSSGPLAFDAAGNLYYAPGFGDNSIYRWSSTEVANAIAGGSLSVAGHQLLDYSSLLSGGGASSMAVDANGVILLTWTNFGQPSTLIAFNAEGDGNYLGTKTLATSDGRMGQVSLRDGQIYISDENSIYQLAVPEPSTVLVSALSGVLLIVRRRRHA